MKHLKGLLFGLTSGALFGLLFSPGKGKELRTKLKKEWKEGETGLNTLTKHFKGMGHDFFEAMQELTESPQIKEAICKGKAKFYEVTGMTPDDVENLANKAREQADKLLAMAKTLKTGEVKKQVKKTVKNIKAKAKKIAKEVQKKIE